MSTIRKINQLLQHRELSCTELTEKYLSEINTVNKEVNAYVTVTADAALQTAKKVDEKLSKGETLSPLEGIPMTLKDNISTKGIETTCCSKMLEGYNPIYNATVWDILKGQNAVLLGKSNMDEFAMGSSSETSFYGEVTNPHNPKHVAGGSSGGVACAVSSNIAAYGLGSDTGGSIRQPASFCGIVGLKPTYGAVSRFGVVAYASSFDQVGPIANTVEDAAIIYDAIAKYDEKDSTSRAVSGAACDTLKNDIKGMKIGVPRECMEGMRDDVKQAIEQSIKVYEDLGAEIIYFNMPALEYAVPVYYILSCAEASSNLGRFDGIRFGYKTPSYNGVDEMICKTRSEGFGDEVKRRILLGTYVLSAGYYDAYYKKAQNLRGTIVKAYQSAFEHCDVILSPTVPMAAFEKGRAISDPIDTYLTDVCTAPVNIAGLPAVSVPCGENIDGLPIGMQLTGNKFCESTILNAAWQFEQVTRDTVFKETGLGVSL